jgi:hypothetical protein
MLALWENRLSLSLLSHPLRANLSLSCAYPSASLLQSSATASALDPPHPRGSWPPDQRRRRARAYADPDILR